MHKDRNVFTRPDTLLGVCQAVGDDFGFNPLILRVAFGVPLVWNPAAMIAAYLVLGVIVMVSRLLFPNPAAASASTSDASPANMAEQEEPELALAA